MSLLEDYRNECVRAALDQCPKYWTAIIDILESAGQVKVCTSLHEDQRDTEELVKRGWLHSIAGPQGRTLYRLSDDLVANLDEAETRFNRIVKEAAGIWETGNKSFLQMYERIANMATCRESEVVKELARVLGICDHEPSKMLINDTVVRYNRLDKKLQTLIKRDMAMPFSFCGKPCVTITGKLMAHRLRAMMNVSKAVGQRNRTIIQKRQVVIDKLRAYLP